MKALCQTIILLGVPHWVVSVIEFVLYQKTSESLYVGTFFLGIGLGGLVIYNKIKDIK